MYPTTLRQLLADPAFGPNRVQDASTTADQWFTNDASLASFVFRSVFRDLIDRGWADPQGRSVHALEIDATARRLTG